MPKHIEDLLEDSARNGDSQAAIALSILKLAEAQQEIASAIQRLGVGDASTSMGAVELLAGEVKGLGERIEGAMRD